MSFDNLSEDVAAEFAGFPPSLGRLPWYEIGIDSSNSGFRIFRQQTGPSFAKRSPAEAAAYWRWYRTEFVRGDPDKHEWFKAMRRRQMKRYREKLKNDPVRAAAALKKRRELQRKKRQLKLAQKPQEPGLTVEQRLEKRRKQSRDFERAKRERLRGDRPKWARKAA